MTTIVEIITFTAVQKAACQLIEWDGEHYRIQLVTGRDKDKDELILTWWIPPEPPPISLLKYVMENQMKEQESDQNLQN